MSDTTSHQAGTATRGVGARGGADTIGRSAGLAGAGARAACLGAAALGAEAANPQSSGGAGADVVVRADELFEGTLPARSADIARGTQSAAPACATAVLLIRPNPSVSNVEPRRIRFEETAASATIKAHRSAAQLGEL